MKVRYSPRARADIDHIIRYIEARSPGGARNVAASIYAAIRLIADRPKAAPRTDNPDGPREAHSAVSVSHLLHDIRGRRRLAAHSAHVAAAVGRGVAWLLTRPLFAETQGVEGAELRGAML